MIIWKQLFPMCFFMVHKLYTSLNTKHKFRKFHRSDEVDKYKLQLHTCSFMFRLFSGKVFYFEILYYFDILLPDSS
jgi:hypothetical protein